LVPLSVLNPGRSSVLQVLCFRGEPGPARGRGQIITCPSPSLALLQQSRPLQRASLRNPWQGASGAPSSMPRARRFLPRCVAQLTPPFPTLPIHRDRLRGWRPRTVAGLVTRRIRCGPSAAGRWQVPRKTAVGFAHHAHAAAPLYDRLGDPCSRGRRCVGWHKALGLRFRGRWRHGAIGTHLPREATSREVRRKLRPMPNSVDPSGPRRTLLFPSSKHFLRPLESFLVLEQANRAIGRPPVNRHARPDTAMDARLPHVGGMEWMPCLHPKRRGGPSVRSRERVLRDNWWPLRKYRWCPIPPMCPESTSGCRCPGRSGGSRDAFRISDATFLVV